MAREPEPTRPRIAIEDVLVCVLGISAGPLLWWMSSLWQQLPAASSVQTLEYWIASACGFVGVGLCVLWSFYCLSALGFALGLKTRNAVLTYWSEVLTPRFLRRLVISVLGAQVMLTSQAFAVPSEDPSAEAGTIQHEPFMPYVHTEPTENPTVSSTATPEVPVPTVQPSMIPSQSTPTRSTEPFTTPSTPPATSRQESQMVVTPEPTIAPSPSGNVEPTPRQTSTINVVPEGAKSTDNSVHPSDKQNAFTPQQPVASPNITVPNESRSTEEPTVVVKSGDCLWDIAAHELGADASLFDVDRRWRQWWEYNHETIGEDPHTLRPGTVLISPPFS